MAARTTLLGICLALVFLILVLWKIDLDKLSTSLADANYWYVLPAALLTLSGYVLRTFRWARILRPTIRIAMRDLFPILMVGFMANNVLPARAGEFVRVYVLHRQVAVSKSLGLATIAIERLLDGLTLLLFVAVVSLRFPLPEWGTGLARLAGLLFLGFAGLVAIILMRAGSASRLADRVASRLPQRLSRRANAMFEAALLGLQALRRRRLLLAVLSLSILIWAAEASSYFLIIRGFNLGLPSGGLLLAAVFALVVVNLAIMLPSAPGYVGTFQAFAVLALSAFGVQREPALAVAVVSHGVQYVLVTGLGFVFLWRTRMSLVGIRRGEGAPSTR